LTNPLDFLLSGSHTRFPRIATMRDNASLLNLIQNSHYVHRHLDWHQPLEWIGHEPFWLLENTYRVLATLAIPPDPPGVAWIRLFACSDYMSVEEAWKVLLEKCIESFQEQTVSIAAIGLSSWFGKLLLGSQFEHYQDIVVLERNIANEEGFTTNGITIRPVREGDFDQVLAVDNLAFELIWQISEDELKHAMKSSKYTSVAIHKEKIIGYQLSTGNPFSAHLARLAVLPEFQGHGIGYSLVQDLLAFFQRSTIPSITVNTQQSNHASLHLYQKLGFHLTGETFPIFRRNLPG
jgi:ribosomal protein S18 acetylase RimI-like enzyme